MVGKECLCKIFILGEKKKDAHTGTSREEGDVYDLSNLERADLAGEKIA